MRMSKKFVIDTDFITEACKLDLSLAEFLLLTYFENADNLVFDINIISEKLKMEQETILNAFNNLMSKNIITLISEKNENGKRYDKVSLDNFYNGIKVSKDEAAKKNLKEDIFTKFETEFGRPLSSMEFEIIKTWVEKLYDEELIIEALNEAVYNGAINIRYIDTILYEWNKLGLKNKEDLRKNRENRYENRKIMENSDYEYNWLEENDK